MAEAPSITVAEGRPKSTSLDRILLTPGILPVNRDKDASLNEE